VTVNILAFRPTSVAVIARPHAEHFHDAGRLPVGLIADPEHRWGMLGLLKARSPPTLPWRLRELAHFVGRKLPLFPMRGNLVATTVPLDTTQRPIR